MCRVVLTGKEAQEIVLGKAREGLAGVEKQEVTAERYSSLDKSPATYGVVKRLRDNDMELHTDKQVTAAGCGDKIVTLSEEECH